MIKVDYSFFDDISPKEEAYIEVLSKAAMFFADYRYESKLTQEELAEKLGVAQAMVSKLESGDCNISLKNLSDYLFELGKKLVITAVSVNNQFDYFGHSSTYKVTEPISKLMPDLKDEEWIMAA